MNKSGQLIKFGLTNSSILVFLPGCTEINKSQLSDNSSTTSSTISTAEIRTIIEKLRYERHRSSTRAQYYCIWKTFNKFYLRLDVKPGNWEDGLALFVGYLIDSNRKALTVKSYISAIKAVLSEVNVSLQEDESLLGALARACKLRDNNNITKLPIKFGMMKLILQSLDNMLDQQQYLLKLYQAMVVSAYFGLFHIGELTCSQHVVTAVDVHVGLNKDKLMFILRSSKTHTRGCKPQIIKITAALVTGKEEMDSNKICPFKIIRQYLAVHKSRRDNKEQFFVFYDRSPVFPHQFRKILSVAINKIGLNSKLYCSHCFRAGRALDMLDMGISVETIKKIGRWKSNAVFTYLNSL